MHTCVVKFKTISQGQFLLSIQSVMFITQTDNILYIKVSLETRKGHKIAYLGSEFLSNSTLPFWV